jgi:malate dehydrogenase (quinone)
VNFGALTRDLLEYLDKKDNIKLSLNSEVKDIEREDD